MAAFKAFTSWSPAALKNSQDPAFIRPDVVHAGVFILECTDDEVFDATLVEHVGAAVDSRDEAVAPTSSSSSSDSGQASGGVSSPVGVPDRSHNIQPHESSVAVAAEYLTSSEELSESELAATIAAGSGGVPPFGDEFVNGYCVIHRADNQRGDWKAMIAYLVADLIASGRAVTSRDRKMLRSWRHKYGAVLRRNENERSRPAVVATTSSRKSSLADSSAGDEMHAPVVSEPAVEAVPNKKAKLRKEPSHGSVNVSRRCSVPLVFFYPDGPPTEGDFSSASGAMSSAGRSRCF